MSRDFRQLPLFEPPKPKSPPRAALESLAARLPGHVRLGTSSWTFEGWHGLVYQRGYTNMREFVQESLREYASWPLFGTVGVDRSYYEPLSVDDLAHYAKMLPEGFRCVMKVWSRVTTRVFPDHPRFGDMAGRPNPDFLDPDLFSAAVAGPVLEAFADHAGPMVLQLPPAPGPVDPRELEARLSGFLSEVPAELEYAVELRDRRLFTDGYLGVLREHGASHVFNHWSAMPPLGEQLAREGSMPGPVVVVRLLLPPGARYEELKDEYAPFDRIVAPDETMRQATVDLCRAAGDRGYDVFVIVNNKAEGCSPLTVHALAERLAEE